MSMNKMYNDTATTPNKTPEKIEMSRIKLRDDTTTPPTKTDTGSANENITDKSDLPPEVDDVEQVTRAETAATSRSGTSMATTDDEGTSTRGRALKRAESMEAGEDISGIEKKDDPVRLSDWVDPKDVREGRVRVYSPSGREASAEEYENDPERPACIRERVEGIQERLQKKLAALKLQKQKEAKDDKKGN